MLRNKILIEIVSDIVCPWCVIGYKNLLTAIRRLEKEMEFEISWLPYQLHPQIPYTGIKKGELNQLKLSSTDSTKETSNYLMELGREVNFIFNFSLNEYIPNTFLAHRLIWFSKSKKLQSKLVETLFKAYFTNGIDISSEKNLLHLAISIGLDKQEVQDFLKYKEGEKEVLKQERSCRKRNISGVPTYIFNKKFILPGGQESNTFIAFLKRVKDKEGKNSTAN